MPGKFGKTAWHSPTLSAASHELDPYLPGNGNLGYRVTRYDLALDYRVNSNRLSGTATVTATSYEQLRRVGLDLASSMRVDKVTVN
ncbi:MAG: M1 family peptidase, partial [Gordonia sp. (in: high G+C Gram-positive bacteria)]